MKVSLIHNTPLEVAIMAIRICYDGMEKSDSHYGTIDQKLHLGDKDKKLIKHIIANDHTSTIEHVSYNFLIEDMTRLCLQEHARHRIASNSVKSTRYTLNELKNEESFTKEGINGVSILRASKYIRLTSMHSIDISSIKALEELRQLLSIDGIKIDQIKYALPESYLTKLVFTINARSLRNYLKLRTSNRAHFEIRELSNHIINALPKEHMILFEDIINR